MRAKRLLPPAVVLALVALAVVFNTPLRVRHHAARLDSKDPNERAAARAALLAIGRPAIDSVYPDLVAKEIVEETSGVDSVVFVGRRTASSPRAYQVTEWLAGEPRVDTVATTGSIVCPTATKLARDDAKTEIVVAARKPGSFELRVAVPLDGDPLADPIVSAVKARLSGR